MISFTIDVNSSTVLSITNDGETTSWDIQNLTGTSITADYELTEEGVTYTFSVVNSKN